MITNKVISLSPESEERKNALNTIKYTLLLDYKNINSEILNSSDFHPNDLIRNVMSHCQDCCIGLFEDKSFRERSYCFFGLREYSSSSSYSKMDVIPPSNPIPRVSPSSYAEPEFHFHNLILNHCVMSCYHAIKTELYNNKIMTPYSIINEPINFLPVKKDKDISAKSNKEKSSTASDFSIISESHLKTLPFFEKIRYMKQFSHLWFYVCSWNAKKYKSIFNPTPQGNAMSRIKKIEELDKHFRSAYYFESNNFSNYDLKSIKSDDNYCPQASSMYNMYLTERIFNLRAFYSLCSMMAYIDRKHTYHIDQPDFLPTLASIAKLPNVFSRQHMLIYAMLHIDEATRSDFDFWYYHQQFWEDSQMVVSAHNTEQRFNLAKWKKQFLLFTNYLSSFVIPVYEWCFTIMLLESIEKKYPQNNHTENLRMAESYLQKYMVENCETIIQPYCIPSSASDFIQKDITDIITPLQNIYQLKNIPDHIMNALMELFFNPHRDLELNLSDNLTPEFFINKGKNKVHSNTKRLRNIYIDILRYDYWEG